MATAPSTSILKQVKGNAQATINHKGWPAATISTGVKHYKTFYIFALTSNEPFWLEPPFILILSEI